MRMKTRKHYSSHTNCHALLLETRRISKADIAAGCCSQLWQTKRTWGGYSALGRRWGKPWGKRSSSESMVRKLQDFPFPSCCVPQPEQSAETPKGGMAQSSACTSGVPGWLMRAGLDCSWGAISERSHKEEKKWEGNVSWATTTGRAPRWLQKRDTGHIQSHLHPQVMRVRKPSPWITKTKLLQ